jgi:hypothetical protein
LARYLRWLALGTLGFLATALTLTIGMDPHDWWGTPRIEGVNAHRTGGNTHTSWVKPRQYARGVPWGVVVAGNSRVQLGFDPRSAVWGGNLGQVYNFGLPGTTFPTLVNRLEWTLPDSPPHLLLVGVDLVDFRVSETDWAQWQPTMASPPGRRQELERMAQATLSLDALGEALAAIPQQRSAFPADMTAEGFLPLRDYMGLARSIGQAAMFEQRNRENFRNYLAGPKAVRWAGPGGSDAWQALDRLRDLAASNGVRLVIFTYPYHADLLVGLDRAGVSPALADFRLALAQWAQANGVEAWDFTRLNAVTTIPPPKPADRRTLLADYWEAGHFRAPVGDRIVAAILSGQTDPAFGERLTVAAAQRANAGWTADIAAHLQAQPQAASRLARLYGPSGETGQGPAPSPTVPGQQATRRTAS